MPPTATARPMDRWFYLSPARTFRSHGRKEVRTLVVCFDFAQIESDRCSKAASVGGLFHFREPAQPTGLFIVRLIALCFGDSALDWPFNPQSSPLALHVILKRFEHRAVHVATGDELQVILWVRFLGEHDSFAIHDRHLCVRWWRRIARTLDITDLIIWRIILVRGR
jgi:hypothetical protein